MFGFSILVGLVQAILSIARGPRVSRSNSTPPRSSLNQDGILQSLENTSSNANHPPPSKLPTPIIRYKPMLPELTNVFSVNYWPRHMELADTADSIILGAYSGEMRIVSLCTGRQTQALHGHEDNAIVAICVRQPGHIVSCDASGILIFWNNYKLTRWFHIPGTGRDDNVECMQIVSSDRAVVGTTSGLLLLIDLSSDDIFNTVSIVSAVRAHAKTVRSLVVAAHGSVVVSASADCSARLWDAQTLQPVGEALVGHAMPLNGLAVSGCGQLVASAAYDGSVRIWDVRSCKQVSEPLRKHCGSALSVVFSADGKLLYSGGCERICVWDVSNLEGGVKFVSELQHERMRNVCSLRMSADGTSLIALATEVFVWSVGGQGARGRAGEETVVKFKRLDVSMLHSR